MSAVTAHARTGRLGRPGLAILALVLSVPGLGGKAVRAVPGGREPGPRAQPTGQGADQEPGTQVLKVYPAVVFEGQNVRVQCRVPRHPSNLTVQFGVDGWRSSEKPVDKVTFEMLLEGVPCEAGQAFCLVRRAGGAEKLVVAPFAIVGCDN